MTSLPVAGYYRVSQARDGMQAPEIYESEISRYCSFRSLHLAEVFADIDRSGYKNPERRLALNDLVERRGEFSAVIVPKLSRFGRSLRHLVQLFDTFDSDGIALVFLDMNIDTSTSQGRLLRHIMAAFAEYESDVKADYARANYRHSQQRGRPWGKPPFGYRAENKRYLIVPDEAALIRAIFERYLDGASLYLIATELNAADRLKRGYLWRINHVGRVLDNPAYAGLTSLDGESYPAQWGSIVERATWDEVQRLRLPENRGQRQRKVGTGGPYLLSGLIVCGTCGRPAHHHNKSSGPAYRCMAQRESASCRGGGVGRIRADDIVSAAVLERVRFSLDGHGLSPRDAWDHATIDQRRRVVATVIDRVAIVPREPGEASTCPWKLSIEWKPEFDAELVVTPLEAVIEHRPVQVRQGRPESHRAGRAAKAAKDRTEARRRYFEEWSAVRERLIPDLTRRP